MWFFKQSILYITISIPLIIKKIDIKTTSTFVYPAKSSFLLVLALIIKIAFISGSAITISSLKIFESVKNWYFYRKVKYVDHLTSANLSPKIAY